MAWITVEVPSDLVTPGELLADVQAYEAAGADAVWLTAGSLEPLLLLAAATVVTSRVRLVASLPVPGSWTPKALASVAATLRHLSRDRFTLGVRGGEAPGAIQGLREAGSDQVVLVSGADDGAVAAAAGFGDGLVCELEAAPAAFERVRTLRPAPSGPFELWVRVPAPGGRAAWREALAAAGELGATGVVVPHAPNLLDILRNPEEDDRQDLAVAVG